MKKRLPDDSALLVAKVGVTGGAPAVVEDARMDRVPLDRDPRRSFSGARWALVAGLGAQRFFDQGRAGRALPARDAQRARASGPRRSRRGLAWGFDLALGGGARTLRMPGVEYPVKFAEVAGGASLWKDLVRGPFVLSGGARIGLTWLGRSFPAREELPRQYFFTVTPGLVGGAAWRMTPRLAVLARVRLSIPLLQRRRGPQPRVRRGDAGVEYALGE